MTGLALQRRFFFGPVWLPGRLVSLSGERRSLHDESVSLCPPPVSI